MKHPARVRSYAFGSITVDDRTFTSDVLVYPDRVDASWWRAEGHVLSVRDLAGPVAAKPEVIVVGTGYFGMMKIPEGTIRFLESKNITLVVERTASAVKVYNELRSKGRNVVAALHLTC